MKGNIINSKKQGDVGLGQAIAYFTSVGMSVAIPLTESQRYDLIVDDNERLYRVEVKTTTMQRPSDSYVVQLATCGGNQSWNKKKKFLSSTECDLLFVYSFDNNRYVFPIEEVEGKGSLTLSKDKEQYKV